MSKFYRPKTSYQITSHITVVLILLIVFVAVGYFFVLAKPGEEAGRAARLEELDTARARWDDRRPAAYRYVVDRACSCPDEDSRAYTVTVRSGERVARFPIPVESLDGTLIEAPPRPLSIADVFAIAARSIGEGEAVEFRFDPEFGFPEYLSLRSGDTFEVRDFEVDYDR